MSTLVLDGISPRSKRGNQVTSVDAGRAANLTASQAAVRAAFRNVRGPLADHELVELADNLGLRFSPQRIRSARAELAEDGILVLVEGVYRKTPTGHRARVWALAERGN